MLGKTQTEQQLGWWRTRTKVTGRTVEEHWAKEWKLADGKVTHYRAYDDTAVIAAALQAA